MQFSGMTFTGGFSFYNVGNPNQDPYFNYTTLLLPGNGTNNGTNNTFLDGSTNNFTITTNGTVTQGSSSPFSLTGWSNYFDGTGDYLNTSANAAFTFGTGDLTLECWIYQTATSTSTYRVIFGDDVYGSAGGYTLYSYNNALNLWKGSAGGGTEVIAPAGTIDLNTWTHVAWTRSGSSNRLFINGTQVGATTTDSTNFTSTAMYIAASRLGTFAFAGYISNARALKGTALYTSNFTPSFTPLTAIANTSLLTCQSNRFIDNSTNNFTITRSGDTSVQSFSPFNPTSQYSKSTIGGGATFNGTTINNLSVPPTSTLAFGTGDFTVECWLYTGPPNGGTSSNDKLIFGSFSLTPNMAFFLTYNNNAPAFWNGTTQYTASSVVPTNAWTHVAWVRSSGTLSMYVNGVSAFTPTAMTTNYSNTGTLYIGGHDANNRPYSGTISNFRVVKGTAVYTSNFTPPTSPVTAITNTSLLLNFTNGQITDATSKTNLATIGDAKISTTQSKWGGSSMYFDGVGDNLSVSKNLVVVLGAGNFTVECWLYTPAPPGGGVTNDKLIYGSYLFNPNLLFFLTNGGNLPALWNGTTQYTANTAVTTNTWTHVAWVRSSGTLSMYVNGVSAFTPTAMTTNFNTVDVSYVGGSGSDATRYYSGFINDLRITKGIARYTSNFTPPTAAFPTF